MTENKIVDEKTQTKRTMPKESHTMKSQSTVLPTLHHIGIMTIDMRKMSKWYAQVLGMKPNLDFSSVSESNTGPLQTVLLTNDGANHRIALISWPGLTLYSEKNKIARLQHVAFEFRSLNDLIDSYVRLKALDIYPIIVVNHGPVTSFYYHDPENNVIELFADNFGNWDSSSQYMGNPRSQKFIGNAIDPDKVIDAKNTGLTDKEINQLINSGAFAPSKPHDLRTLLYM